MVRYYEGWELLSVALPIFGKCEASVNDLVDTGRSFYTCECVSPWDQRDSARSDVVLVSTGDIPAAPTIQKEVNMSANSNGENVFVTCKGDIRENGGTFYLYKCGTADYEQHRAVTGRLQHVTFSINVRSKNFAGNYCCGYLTEALGDLYRSPLSKPLAVTEEDKYITSKSSLRHYFSAIVLVLLVLIVVEHFVSACHRKAGKPLEGTDDSSLRNSEATVDVSPS
ncbi:uncharacterized protein LOC121274856 isoform X2 [Carcharodon carcharias]|nr:uncharacterized protein LOC121274856 isoform X2 [Carcharodon carcharias]